MLRIHPTDYDDFVRIVGELHSVSVWFTTIAMGNPFKAVAIGSKNGLDVAVVRVTGATPPTFGADFPNAIDTESSNPFVIDGVNF
jgi:hypothetical protein